MPGMGSTALTLGKASRERQDGNRAEANLQTGLEQKTIIEEIAALAAQLDVLNEEFAAVTIAPKKTNIQVKLFRVVGRGD